VFYDITLPCGHMMSPLLLNLGISQRGMKFIEYGFVDLGI